MIPDLILMDIMLKGNMDGVDAASMINSNLDIPIIYLTAYADTSLLDRAKMTGPYGYIVKPFKENDLRTNVKMALYRHRIDKKLRKCR
jgi:CheY-like chemotaxis protein